MENMTTKEKLNEQKEFVVELTERLSGDSDYNSYLQSKLWNLLFTLNQMERHMK
jgi:hypothetical protein|tara:strand:- start:42 stop:203 length:162 start_codon:yes stop_codon:yes gene_type:complete